MKGEMRFKAFETGETEENREFPGAVEGILDNANPSVISFAVNENQLESQSSRGDKKCGAGGVRV